MTDPYMDRRTAVETLTRIAWGPNAGLAQKAMLDAGPLIGEAFKRAINGEPEQFDEALKAVEALIRPRDGRYFGSVWLGLDGEVRDGEEIVVDERPQCDRAPRGWRCTLRYNHDGPCPARPRWWMRIWLLLGRR